MAQEDEPLWQMQERPCDPAQHPFGRSAVAIAAGDDEIGAEAFDLGQDLDFNLVPRCDRDGRGWVATRMGLQVCDQPGRVNCIIPTPNGKVSNLTFGGENFDILYCTCSLTP